MNGRLTHYFAAALFLLSPVASANCTFSPSLPSVYESVGPTPLEFGEFRRTVIRLFDACPAGPVDHGSRAVFFDIVEKEFSHDFTPMLQAAPVEQHEAMQEGIMAFENRITGYLEQVVNPRDLKYKDTILQVGTGKTIAVLGPPVKDDVLRLATNPDRRIHGHIRHFPQAAAFEALGSWIDPADNRFSTAEKRHFETVLQGVLTATEGKPIHAGMQQMLVVAAVRALGNSDDLAIASSLRKFADGLDYKGGEVYKAAVASAQSIAARHRR